MPKNRNDGKGSRGGCGVDMEEGKAFHASTAGRDPRQEALNRRPSPDHPRDRSPAQDVSFQLLGGCCGLVAAWGPGGESP